MKTLILSMNFFFVWNVVEWTVSMIGNPVIGGRLRKEETIKSQIHAVSLQVDSVESEIILATLDILVNYRIFWNWNTRLLTLSFFNKVVWIVLKKWPVTNWWLSEPWHLGLLSFSSWEQSWHVSYTAKSKISVIIRKIHIAINAKVYNFHYDLKLQLSKVPLREISQLQSV